MNHPPSLEQQTILNSLEASNNVVVNAVAGSGKSTTVLMVALQFPDKRLVQVTYNSQLRHEMKTKVADVNIDNLLIHTYHSLAVCYYLPQAYTDTQLRRIVRDNVPSSKPREVVDILIIDEAQDMTSLYYRLLMKWIADVFTDTFQILVLGDEKQGLYEFKGSDIRYLTRAAELWRSHPKLKTPEFAVHSLQTSYRITRPMAAFVNNIMLGEKRLLACRDGLPVKFFRTSPFESKYKIMHTINHFIKKEHCTPEDFFILAPSLKSFVRELENLLVENQIPCYLPLFENDGLDERVVRGKVVFSTFHSVKGRQRKYVFVLGFDASYFEYFARDAARDVCPNTLYVGCTRATHELFLFERNDQIDDRPLPFLKCTHIEMKKKRYIEFHGAAPPAYFSMPVATTAAAAAKTKTKHSITPTELIKFIPDTTLDELTARVDTLFINQTTHRRDLLIPSVIETTRGFHEDVSDINGLFIPFYFISYKTGNYNMLYNQVKKAFEKTKPPYLTTVLATISPAALGQSMSVPDYLYLANLYSAHNEKLFYRLRQIEKDDYTWLSPAMLKDCTSRLETVLFDGIEIIDIDMEQTIIEPSMSLETERLSTALAPYFPTREFIFTARVDSITSGAVWEWKCTAFLTVDHFLQVIIYAWIWKTLHPADTRDFILFNIRTNEKYQLCGELQDLESIVVLLIKAKYEKPARQEDAVFLAAAAVSAKN